MHSIVYFVYDIYFEFYMLYFYTFYLCIATSLYCIELLELHFPWGVLPKGINKVNSFHFNSIQFNNTVEELSGCQQEKSEIFCASGTQSAWLETWLS